MFCLIQNGVLSLFLLAFTTWHFHLVYVSGRTTLETLHAKLRQHVDDEGGISW